MKKVKHNHKTYKSGVFPTFVQKPQGNVSQTRVQILVQRQYQACETCFGKFQHKMLSPLHNQGSQQLKEDSLRPVFAEGLLKKSCNCCLQTVVQHTCQFWKGTKSLRRFPNTCMEIKLDLNEEE